MRAPLATRHEPAGVQNPRGPSKNDSTESTYKLGA